MKKITFTITFLLFSFLTSAQLGFCVDCYGSIETGVVYSNINGFENANSKTGFYLAYYNYRWINDLFSFRSGLSYQNLGAEIENFDDPFRVHSVGVPLSLHYTFNQIAQGFFGVEGSTNISGRLPVSTDNASNNSDVFFDFRDNVSLFHASVFIGGGGIIAKNIDLNIKYNLGLTNFNTSIDEDKWKHNWITLSVAYTWRE